MSPSLRIAIDASRTTIARITGTEHYALELIRALIHENEHPEHRHKLTLYFRDPPAPNLFPPSSHVEHRVIPFRRIWTHLRFAFSIWKDRPDVTFVPAHTLPLYFPGRAVVTLHDLGFKHFPEAHKRIERYYLDLTTRFSAWRADRILADSIATSQDLTNIYRTNPSKINVVYPGVTPLLIKEIESVRARYNLPANYFIFIGTLQPRKNIARISDAYAQYRAISGDPAELVLAGGRGWLYEEAWTCGIEGIHMPGYINEADKGTLYAGARALVFPTLYEGFGFPVIEAMSCGTPVITSTTSSLPELAGDAALLVNPTNTKAITSALLKLDDNSLREDLGQRGRVNAKRFTWENAAREVLHVLEATANPMV